MAYKPTNVFIKENDEYIEISYKEFCEKQNTEFKDKFFISLHDMLMEVDEAYYIEFYREQRREKYLRERAIEKGDVYYNSLDTEDFCGEEILIDPDEDVAEQVMDKLMIEKLRSVLPLLSEDEYILIHKHYFENIPETELAKFYGVSQQAISKRMLKIRAKLKNLIEN